MTNPFLSDSIPFIFLGWAWLAWAVPAAASFLGGMMGNRSSAKEAALNRDFQEAMSRTAHQREVGDLEAAGLNPILSATGGQGASTPSGATAQQRDPAAGVVSSALAGQRQKQELKNMKAQEGLTNEQDAVARQTRSNLKQQGLILEEQHGTAQSSRSSALSQSYIDINRRFQSDKDYETHRRGQMGRENEADFESSDYRNSLRYIDAATHSAGQAAAIINPFRSLTKGKPPRLGVPHARRKPGMGADMKNVIKKRKTEKQIWQQRQNKRNR